MHDGWDKYGLILESADMCSLFANFSIEAMYQELKPQCVRNLLQDIWRKRRATSKCCSLEFQAQQF